IGYARKSPSGETAVTRARLLTDMAYNLWPHCLCTKVFVSPRCTSSSKLIARDKTRNPSLLRSIRYDAGDMQGK
ncbi:hypothetical protein DM01DRAFT_240916, partial [Hesseltinella vesiculosa]